MGRLEARQSYVLIESDGHSGERERHSGEHDAKRARVERPSKRLLSESVRNQFRSKESSVDRITMKVDYSDVESTNYFNVLSGCYGSYIRPFVL